MNKKIKYFFSYFILIITSMIILGNCSLSQWSSVIANSDKIDPKWDTGLYLTVVDKTINISKYIDTSANYTYSVDTGAILDWPPPATLAISLGGTIPIIDIDLDLDTIDDFIISGFYSEEASLILSAYLEQGGINRVIDTKYLDISDFAIEGVQYNDFTITNDANNVIKYTCNNFLDPDEKYYIDIGGDNDIDITFDITLKNDDGDPVVYNNATLYFQFDLDLGKNYGVSGTIVNTAEIYTDTDKDVPIDTFPINNIEDFKFEFIFDSGLSFDTNLQLDFTGNPTPDPNNYTTVIEHGNMGTRSGYEYVKSAKESMKEFTFNGNVLDYDDLKMDVAASLPNTSGEILLTTNDYINLLINVRIGNVTIDL